MSSPSSVPLVGRDAHVLLVHEQLTAARSRGRLIGVLGEPGVGKSALLDRAVQDARTDGFGVLTARGSHSESHLPFAALHQLLRPVLSHVDRLPVMQREALLACFGMGEGAAVEPFFASLAVLELLAEQAAQHPLLVCLDDLHWMDRPSVDAIAFVARRIGGERILILCTSRDPSLPVDLEDSATFVRLPSLDVAASVELLGLHAPQLSGGVRDRVLQRAAGNPLAILEFAAAVDSGRIDWTDADGDLPMTARLEHAFLSRADELDPVARCLLDVAAVDDGENVEELVAATQLVAHGPAGPGTVQSAADLGLLTVAGATYRFGHPLIGSAVRQVMPATTRRRAHAALAEVLSGHPQRAVWHRAASRSGPDEQVAAELEEAALAAHQRGAVSTALLWLGRSAALSPDPEAQASRLLSAAEFGYELGRFAEVEQITARVRRMTLRDRERSRLTWLEGVFHDGSSSEPAEILHLLGLARQAIDDDDVDLALQLLIGAARRVWWRDPGDEVRRQIVRVVDDAAVPPHDPRVLAVLGLSESVQMAPRIMTELSGWSADADGRPDLAGLLGIAAFCIGDQRRAVAHLSAAIEALRHQGRLALLAEALAIRSWAEINLGVFDASRSADEAMRLADETRQSVWAATARIAVALVDAVRLGQSAPTTLLTQAEQTAVRMPNASSSLLAAVQLTRGIADLGDDRPEAAYDELLRVFAPDDPAHQRVQQLWTISYLVDAAIRTGHRDDASAQLSAMERLTSTAPAVGPLIGLEYSRAMLADDDQADELFRVALDGAGRMFPWHRARLELAHGSWLRRHRRVLESRAPLRAARGTFDALGAHPWALRADRELRATGERGWRPSTNPSTRLSPQERQIAGLAAQGLSNREIGERLFLSHRTVGSHLYRIFPKLGVTSRGQLAGVLAESDLPTQPG